MKKVLAGYRGATHDEEFEFPDDVGTEEIEKELYEWVQDCLEVWWEEE